MKAQPSVRAAVTVLAPTLAAVAGGILLRRRARALRPITRSITVGRPAPDLYRVWLDLLPRTMEPLARVAVDAERVTWYVKTPLRESAYETRISEATPSESLTWRAPDDGRDAYAGSVRFSAAPADRGTEVTLQMKLAAPEAFAGPALRSALRRFKSLVETGEVPSLERNPSARA